MDILKAVVQGIIQGITEWLPISSTGHLLLWNHIWGYGGQAFYDIFKVVIQLGSILAVIVLYFKKLNPFCREKTPSEKKGTWVLWGKVLIASIPAGAAGLLLNDQIDNSASLPSVIACALIIYGIAFIVMERIRKKDRISRLNQMTFATALGIGVFQMLSLIPGTSRSGSTILGASLLGTSRTVAAEFSFFMAIPVMVGASGFKLLKFFMGGDRSAITNSEWMALLVGAAVAFLVSLLVIRFFIRFIQKHSFKSFGVYRVVLGAVIVASLLLGWLPNTVTG